MPQFNSIPEGFCVSIGLQSSQWKDFLKIDTIKQAKCIESASSYFKYIEKEQENWQ